MVKKRLHMTKDKLKSLRINPPDRTIYNKIKQNWDSLSKPLDGLGDFETLICRIGAIHGTEYPPVKNRSLICFCADNGIVSEGVSQCGREVTASVAEALGRGVSTANVLADKAGVQVIPVDIGIDCEGAIPGVDDRKLARGTKNFLTEPAMTEDEAVGAIECGIRIAYEQKSLGADILAAGEMGIGNTTTASAVICSLLDLNPEETVGRGAGLDDAGLMQKLKVVDSGTGKYDHLKELDDFDRAFETLRCLGGLDIAGMTGLFIGAALSSLPVVADGVISLTSALLAERLIPGVKEYMIASHSGREKGSGYVLSELGLKPYICGDMALGEGTGALMLFPLIDMAYALYSKGTHFEDAGIKAYERFEK